MDTDAEELDGGPGDLQTAVAVWSGSSSGNDDGIWIDVNAWRTFLADLTQLELTRRGTATVTAMSPDEFKLAIRSTDAAGHLSADGFLGRRQLRSTRQWMTARIGFSLELDPSRLSDLTEQFRTIGNSGLQRGG